MSGRRSIPGEKGISTAVEPRAVLNRTIRAQVSSVDTKNGFVTLTYDALPSGGKLATVEPLWMSFPSSGKPAWGRFMPQTSDLVKVTFDYEDKPHVTGYDVEAPKDGIGDSSVGWPALNNQYEKCAAGENDDRPQFANFVPLNQGEYDFMSSGGAYIYGNDAGRLYLAGGAVSISLVKNDLKLGVRALYNEFASENTLIRFGQVRRTSADGSVTKLSSDANGSYKEFNVNVEDSSDSKLATFVLGNVADDTAVINSSDGNPLRARLETFDSSGASAFKAEVDTSGNHVVTSTSGNHESNFSTHTINATSQHIVASPTIKLGSDSASNPLLLTNTYKTAEQNLATALITALQSLNTAIGTLNTAIGAFATATGAAVAAVDSGATTAAAVTLNAAIVAATAAQNAAVQTGNTAVQSFNNAYDTYLSKVSSTD